MRSKKCILTILLLSLCSSACSSSSALVDYNNNNKDIAQISFSWWGNDDRISYTLDGVDIFCEQNPNIDVKCKYGVWTGYDMRQNIYMLSNESPDVMQINFDWIQSYSPDGDGFYNIYDLADEVDLSNFSEQDLSYGEGVGKLNAIPIALNTHCIFVNKDIYSKYGLDIPKSWDDYFKAAEVMRNDNVYPISMGNKPLFFFLLAYFEQTTGKSACDEDGALVLTKDDIKIMLEFYSRLMDEKVLMPVIDSDYASLANGHSAATMRWISGTQTTFDGLFKKNVDIEVAPYPTISGNIDSTEHLGWYVKPATLLAVSKNTENPKEAAKLLDFLLNSKDMALLQKTEKGIPISRSAIEVLSESGEFENNIDYTATERMLNDEDKMTVMYPILEKTDVYKTFYDEAAYYVYKEKSLDEVTDKIYDLFYNKGSQK